MKGKRSFVLYTDLLHTIEKLSDKKAGELFKYILMYVNDQEPKTDDMIVNIAFEPIKQQLKRDLQKWQEIREKRVKAGQASANKRQQVSTSVKSVEQNEQVSTVNVSVNDNVIVNILKEYSYFNNDSFKKCLIEYKKHRTKLKKPMTDHAIKLFLSKLSKLSKQSSNLAIQIINQSIENGWLGIFDLKDVEPKDEIPKY